MGRKVAGRISSGGKRPSRAVIEAPMAPSGRRMRSMGRRESDASPPMRLGNRCAASMPESMRMVEPELPASSIAVGGSSPSRPRPAMPTFAPSRSTRTPTDSRAPSVEAQSAPVE